MIPIRNEKLVRNHHLTKRLHTARVWAFVLLLALLGSFQPTEADELPFFPVWIGESGELSEQEVESLVADFAAKNPNPEHIYVWVHGFDTSRAASTEQYKILTERLNKSLQKQGQSAAVVGIQWDSKVKLTIFNVIGRYDQKTRLARKTGRHGTRAFLLSLQKRFPQAHINLFGHSMGCEVSMGAVRPRVNFDGYEDKTDMKAFEPEADLRIHAAALLGADLNYDIGAKSQLPLRSDGAKLFWLTESSAFRKEDRDLILSLRAIVAGKALGSTFPRMTEEQYDGLLGNQVIVFDNREVPRTHKFLLYYDQERVDRLVRGTLYKGGYKVEPPPELAEISEVMEAPNTVESLKPFLDRDSLSSKIYTIWRLEHHFGSGSKNLANGTLEKVRDTLLHRPKMVRDLRPNSDSQTVRDGIWPTPANLARAGAPAWASPLGNGRRVHFRGRVEAMEDGVLWMVTEFGDNRYFDLENTEYIPSEAGVRVGSYIEIQSVFKDAERIDVIPLGRWIKMGLPTNLKSKTFR
jgi:esterase/lipase superfamily enzyme